MSAEILTDRVYHVTTLDVADSILENGLRPNPNRGKSEAWQACEALIDDIAPEWVAASGLLRRQAVFAHAETQLPEKLYSQNTCAENPGSQHLVALEVTVDPDQVMVCSAAIIDMLFLSLDRNTKAPVQFSDYRKRDAARYWGDAITLRQYRELYEPDDWNTDFIVRKKTAPKDMPHCKNIYLSEVLIPGPVEPEAIRWVSSSAAPLKANLVW